MSENLAIQALSPIAAVSHPSHEDDLERMIQEKRLNAPRLNPGVIDATIMGCTFTKLPSGKKMVCEITLRNGFTVTGESSTVSKENFDEEIGKKISFENARDKIWMLEGYLLQQKLYEDVMVSLEQTNG